MLSLRLSAAFAALGIITSSTAPLRVMRIAPETPAAVYAEVTVTFDRPVAGGLNESVDAARIFSISPAIDGRVEWRDPHTIRFTHDQPFTPGQTYTVRIAPAFSAMDGSTLERAYEHTFRAAFPRALTGHPAASDRTIAQYLPHRPAFRVLLSAPVDLAQFADRSRIVTDSACGRLVVPVRAVAQRPIANHDPRNFRWTGARAPDSARDLRRVVELEAVSDLPPSCNGRLRVPIEAAPPALAPDSNLTAWSFMTRGPLRVTHVGCAAGTYVQRTHYCATGPVHVLFSTPVSGADVMRHVRIIPTREFTVDTAQVSAEWVLGASLEPRRSWAVVVDRALHDAFGQPYSGRNVHAFNTSGFAPTVVYTTGRQLVERVGIRTLAVQHVNIDTLAVTVVPVPDSLEGEFLASNWSWGRPWNVLRTSPDLVQRRVAVNGARDARLVSGVRLPDAAPGAGNTLLAVTVASAKDTTAYGGGISLVQVTDLAVHARMGLDQGMVWVTGVGDGLARANVDVEWRDPAGRVRATGRTDARGLTTLRNPQPAADMDDRCRDCWGFEGYIAARTADDRSLVGLRMYDPDLAAWRFGVWNAWGNQREAAAATVFTERGIYRPGETVYAKSIVRDGPLGALASPAGDSVRWTFRDREDGTLRDTTVTLSAFGTTDARLPLAADLPLGRYRIQVDVRRTGEWKTLAETSYQVAEYRPPEFLVDAVAAAAALMTGDTAEVTVGARYLFGAPMAASPVNWNVRITPRAWGVSLPGAEDFTIGTWRNWWEDRNQGASVVRQGVDTLDEAGYRTVRVALPQIEDGRPAIGTLVATVTDANRQAVSAAASFTVHPAAFYIGARTMGDWFWTAGRPVTVEVIAIRPNGERISDVAVEGVVLRRTWHRVRRMRDGQLETISNMVLDSIARCDVRTATEGSTCTFTPPSGGSYDVVLKARDQAGRGVTTSLGRWAAGREWVPWNDDSQFRMDVIPDRQHYDVGDTATIFFASPFTDAEAWVTVERERVLESRRIRITSGATTLKFPITEAYAPNAYVSIIVVRGRSAEPGPLDDPGRPTLRVGYAPLRVLPAVKRLTVDVSPLAAAGAADTSGAAANSAVQPATDPSRTTSLSRLAAPAVVYEPGDTARIGVRVRDADGRGVRAEVTLWAVDEGVLALTGYTVPDPVASIYAERGLGVLLASNLSSVAAQIPEGQKGGREPGGGGGGELAGILRSRFQTTAFFLGSVVTDAAGLAEARAKLPDNLTTFRVMAVAVTAGDRYGSGQSSFLVTRPLVARPALPRFVREGDRFLAGVVVNQRAGGTPRVQVEARSTGIRIEGDRRKQAQLAAGRGAEVRFDFRATAADSAHFQFAATAGEHRDAVALAVPVRPWFHPLAATIASVVRDTASAEFVLRDDLDPDRSRIDISFGSTPIALINGMRHHLRIYPYQCTEQVSSIALPLIALYRMRNEMGMEAEAARLHREVDNAVRVLLRRQTSSGGIGYWGGASWTTPWMSSYAGRVLLEAKEAGIAVDSAALARLADYVGQAARDDQWLQTPVAWWYNAERHRLSERLAAADFLSRSGRPSVALENSLLQRVGSMRWEDRVLLAELLARRNELQPARALLTTIWQNVRIEGRKAVLPDTARESHYFRSTSRPTARLLTATLAVQPDHPIVGPLVESLVDRGRAGSDTHWNTQDYGQMVFALLAFERLRRETGGTRVTVHGARGRMIDTNVGSGTRLGAATDTTFGIGRLVTRDAQGRNVLRLDIASQPAAGVGLPVWFFATVHEVPKTRPLDPVYRGLVVERWYEDIDTKQPVSSVREGELVRVRVRINVDAERHFVVLDDPLPAGLEPVDLSLRTVAPLGAAFPGYRPEYQSEAGGGWWYGSWDSGFWSPFDHRELRDDRVIWSASVLWPGTYTASYIARATTAGTFIVPPAHAEEMYNPGVNGRTGGITFTVTRAQN